MAGSKPLIFMRFHGVFLGSQHEMWSKQHNGKVSKLRFSFRSGAKKKKAAGDPYSRILYLCVAL